MLDITLGQISHLNSVLVGERSGGNLGRGVSRSVVKRSSVKRSLVKRTLVNRRLVKGVLEKRRWGSRYEDDIRVGGGKERSDT